MSKLLQYSIMKQTIQNYHLKHASPRAGFSMNERSTKLLKCPNWGYYNCIICTLLRNCIISKCTKLCAVESKDVRWEFGYKTIISRRGGLMSRATFPNPPSSCPAVQFDLRVQDQDRGGLTFGQIAVQRLLVS